MGQKIAIVDYALGNLFNVRRAFSFFSADTIITNIRNEVDGADKLVLPGVGAFGEGMRNLKDSRLVEVIRDAANSGKPILGICLGMQLLLSESEEFGRHPGLDLVPGRVVKFDLPKNFHFKIPQIGWNRLLPSLRQKQEKDGYWKNTLLRHLSEGAPMYFVHSFYSQVEDQSDSVAVTEYGHNKFCSALQRENVYGCQFHPERSGDDGLLILKHFINL